MALQLVGETLDRQRAYHLAASGRLVSLMRGVYIDPEDDPDIAVLRHAVRIARYLYPHAYLAGVSAARLGPTEDGRLFLSGRRKDRTRLRALEIVQSVAPVAPSLVDAIVDDGLGELNVKASSTRQRFLESFRTRTEQAAAFDAALRQATADRLRAEHADLAAVIEALWAVARANRWYSEAEHAQAWLERRPGLAPPANAAAFSLTVAWHGRPIGRLAHDGFDWRWSAEPSFRLPLVRQTVPGELPPFILSLLPEGWLETVLGEPDERRTLRSGKRYLSNIAIVSDAAELANLADDVLSTSLSDHVSEGVFTGRYEGPGRELQASFEANLARIFASAQTPRLSGVQIKAPMALSADARLSASIATPFTHILKPAGSGAYAALPLVEMLGLTLARAAGFEVPAFALVAMPDNLPPALVVERFDIRKPGEDRRLAMEDFCSILDVPPRAKYDGTIERAARAIRGLSTDPEADVELLLRRAIFAWFIADGDLHLKNLALLRIPEPQLDRFVSVRVAPVYDCVTTRGFPGLAGDRLAMKLNGKDDRLSRADVTSCAQTIGLTAARAAALVEDLRARLGPALDRFDVPLGLDWTPEALATLEDSRSIIAARLQTLV